MNEKKNQFAITSSNYNNNKKKTQNKININVDEAKFNVITAMNRKLKSANWNRNKKKMPKHSIAKRLGTAFTIILFQIFFFGFWTCLL